MAKEQWNKEVKGSEDLKKQAKQIIGGESLVGIKRSKCKGPGVEICWALERHSVAGAECDNRR